jgi:hypothetical protein
MSTVCRSLAGITVNSAYPPDRPKAISPSASSIRGRIPLSTTPARALRQHSDALHNAVLADGQSVSNASAYVNYAVFDTPLGDILSPSGAINAHITPERSSDSGSRGHDPSWDISSLDVPLITVRGVSVNIP